MNASVPTSYVTVFAGLSVDGFIARLDGKLDFLDPPEGVDVSGDDHGFFALLDRTDALVMGRSTYDVLMGFDVDWPYPCPVFVLTHRPIETIAEGADVRGVQGEPQDVVAELASQGFHRLYVDGGATVQQFLAAGAVDELILTQVPILIGDGIPLFGSLHADIRLTHKESRTLSGGMVQNHYRIES